MDCIRDKCLLFIWALSVRYKTIKSKDVKMAHTNRARITENDLIFEYKLFVGAHGRWWRWRWRVECPQEHITYSFGMWGRSIDLPVWPECVSALTKTRWSSRLRLFNGPSQWSFKLKRKKKRNTKKDQRCELRRRGASWTMTGIAKNSQHSGAYQKI